MKELKQTQILSCLLYAGAAYFAAVALVHTLGAKVPGLFIYFNVPSYAYQDRIISFLSFGWTVFFVLAGRKPNREMVRAILFIGLVALLALTMNTLFTDFNQLDENIEPRYFLTIIFMLFLYWLSLIIFSREILKQSEKN